MNGRTDHRVEFKDEYSEQQQGYDQKHHHISGQVGKIVNRDPVEVVVNRFDQGNEIRRKEHEDIAFESWRDVLGGRSGATGGIEAWRRDLGLNRNDREVVSVADLAMRVEGVVRFCGGG